MQIDERFLFNIVAVVASVSAAYGIMKQGLKGVVERVAKLESETVNKKTCDLKHEAVNKELARGDDKFGKIEKTLEEQGKTLTRMDKLMALIAHQMGVKDETEH